MRQRLGHRPDGPATITAVAPVILAAFAFSQQSQAVIACVGSGGNPSYRPGASLGPALLAQFSRSACCVGGYRTVPLKARRRIPQR